MLTPPVGIARSVPHSAGEVATSGRLGTRSLFSPWAFLLRVDGLSLLLAACGSSSPDPGATHVMADGTVMSGSSMSGSGPAEAPVPKAGATGRGAAPSDAASMICSGEVRDAVRRELDLDRAPVGLHAWSHRLYSCTYQLAGGDLRLSVKDLDSDAPGRAYFARLRSDLPRADQIRGLASFGFPSFQTSRGDVVFLKDHKTLWVDATRLAASDLPAGTSRADIAYGIAAAVIACWTE